MCIEVQIGDDLIDTCGELADLIGGMGELPVGLDREQCLCGVGAERVLLENGYWVRKTPFGYEARKDEPR